MATQAHKAMNENGLGGLHGNVLDEEISQLII
jgi:hypothetical protein